MSQTEAESGQSLPLLGEDVPSKVVPSVNPMLIRIETLGPGNARLVPTPFVKPRREQNHHPASTSISCARPSSSESLKKRKQTFPPRSPTMPSCVNEEHKTKRTRTLVLKLDSSDGHLRLINEDNNKVNKTETIEQSMSGIVARPADTLMRNVVVNQAGNIQRRQIAIKPKLASDSAYSSLQPTMRIINTDPIRQRRKRRTKQEMDALRAEMMDKKRTLQESGIRVPNRRGPARISSMDSVVRHSRQFDLQAVKNSVLLPEETCAMLRPCCLANDGCRTLCWHSPINGRIGEDSLPTMAQVVKWSVNDVGDFLSRFGLEGETIHRFKEQLIDGEALLLLTRDDLIAQLTMKLGPAIKLQNRLLLMKHLNVERVC